MILDGGMGHLLRRNGIEISGPIGTMERFLGVALANRDAPELVVRSHLEYIDAGADVITTNTYACVPAAVGANEEGTTLATDLIHAGGELAQAARAEAGRDSDLLIAGCLPPLHESYRPDRVGDHSELSTTYSTIVRAIAPYSDVLLCETMSSAAEGYAAAEAASAVDLPIWMAFTVAEDAGDRLRSGETIAEGLRAIATFPNIAAVLVNCSSVAAIDLAVTELAESGITAPLGAYANGLSLDFLATIGAGTASDGSEYDETITPAAYARAARGWMEQGASIVGGCCGIFPEHIAAVARDAG